jgi:hypothetical protein
VVWPQRYQARPRAIEWAVQGLLAFIAFNATVVFGARAIRWVGLAATLLITILVCHTYRPRCSVP